MIKSIWLIVFLFIGLSLRAQNHDNDFRINIGASNAFKGTIFLMNIYKRADSIKVIYKLKDSVNYKGLFSNKRYNDLRKYTIAPLNVTANFDTVHNAFMESSAITEKYTYYSKDSIMLNIRTYPSYTNLLEKIVKTSRDELENTKANKDRVVMDGTHYGFDIIFKSGEKVVQAHSPDPKSHPLLYRLLQTTFNVYRDRKHNEFLDKPGMQENYVGLKYKKYPVNTIAQVPEVMQFNLPKGTKKLNVQQFKNLSHSGFNNETISDFHDHIYKKDGLLIYYLNLSSYPTNPTYRKSLENNQKVMVSLLGQTKDNIVDNSKIISINNIRFLIIGYHDKDINYIRFTSD
ncbi:MAG: hypothetical protein JWP37_2515, partial [Mucilaginibacter sp.]|nr:hypothetical protein [Mucilaginibacter sp.]